MTLKKLADNAIAQINDTVSSPLPESETEAISKIIEDMLVEAVRQTSQSCSKAAVVCCGPEADIAHKIAEGVDQARHALIANLMSLR
jgi:hypothetical protein